MQCYQWFFVIVIMLLTYNNIKYILTHMSTNIDILLPKAGNPNWVKGGPSPNPGGSRGRKPILDALEKYINRPVGEDGLSLPDNAIVADLIALRVIKNAAEGKDESLSLKYFQEIMNRCYGMPKQAIVGGDENDRPIQVTHNADKEIIEAYLKSRSEPETITAYKEIEE